jgi:hypothetical protein
MYRHQEKLATHSKADRGFQFASFISASSKKPAVMRRTPESQELNETVSFKPYWAIVRRVVTFKTMLSVSHIPMAYVRRSVDQGVVLEKSLGFSRLSFRIAVILCEIIVELFQVKRAPGMFGRTGDSVEITLFVLPAKRF